MRTVDDRLTELGIALPALFGGPPGFERRFDRVHVDGGLAYVSGHGPVDGATVLSQGRVGGDLTPEDGYAAARATGLSILASLRDELGSLERVGSWVKALGLVRAAPGFTALPGVMDGFTDLVLELWGPERGRHARSAIGVAELPFGIPVEVEAIVRLAD
ncbi:RidA family protein [Paraconexibacter algicola]|uniref:Endoribonuclease L-PSP/chorismate mutase-like domain-containing protein n=1 Tax=Paraconexibacter algicola TaxID=2133960 RepID=A0A2T4UG67_9ACTN|nr:RidA family protein [Paraconexibacter algicola]PTL58220.1 hypothetical protein C7Y72_00440 [Paraconexibacter algicola]